MYFMLSNSVDKRFTTAQNLMFSMLKIYFFFWLVHSKKRDMHVGIMYIMDWPLDRTYVLLEQVNVGILTEEANEQNYANIFNKVRSSFHFFSSCVVGFQLLVYLTSLPLSLKYLLNFTFRFYYYYLETDK